MKKTKVILILMLILVMALAVNVEAATGSFKVSKDSVTLKEEKTTTFSITTTNCEGQFKITSSDTNVVKVSSASIWVSSSENITLTAVKAGTAKITITASDVADTDEKEVTGSKTITVKVEPEKVDNGGSNNNTGSNNGTTNNNSTGNNNTTTNNNTGTTTKPVTKSTNAYLSTLGVTPKEYDFSGFKQTNLTYSVTVPYEVEELKVLYKTAHSGATVNVTGNTGFEVGSNNKIAVKVTAEDGKTTKTYTIKVTKLAEVEEKPGNIIEDEEGLLLSSLSINGVDLFPEFSKNICAYTATLSKNLAEVEVKAVANKENAIIEVSGNKNLAIGENIINIIVKKEDSSEQTVYQITLTKEVDLTTNDENTDFMSNLIDNIRNYVIIAIIVVVLIIAAVITLIILLRKENKRLKEQEIE